MRALSLILALVATQAHADGITAIPYEDLTYTAPNLVTFDRLPPKPFPGYSFDHGIAFPGGHLGERLAGQTLTQVQPDDGGPHDALAGPPTTPLALVPAAPGQGVSLSLHIAHGSMALYPLGPLGQPHPQARGEGAIAVLLTEDACAVGLKVHTQFTNDLGLNTGHVGDVTVTLYARDGTRLTAVQLAPPEGISAHGLFDAQARIAAMTVENRDPGGITIDDLRFGCPKAIG